MHTVYSSVGIIVMLLLAKCFSIHIPAMNRCSFAISPQYYSTIVRQTDLLIGGITLAPSSYTNLTLHNAGMGVVWAEEGGYMQCHVGHTIRYLAFVSLNLSTFLSEVSQQLSRSTFQCVFGGIRRSKRNILRQLHPRPKY